MVLVLRLTAPWGPVGLGARNLSSSPGMPTGTPKHITMSNHNWFPKTHISQSTHNWHHSQQYRNIYYYDTGHHPFTTKTKTHWSPPFVFIPKHTTNTLTNQSVCESMTVYMFHGLYVGGNYFNIFITCRCSLRNIAYPFVHRQASHWPETLEIFCKKMFSHFHSDSGQNVLTKWQWHHV